MQNPFIPYRLTGSALDKKAELRRSFYVDLLTAPSVVDRLGGLIVLSNKSDKLIGLNTGDLIYEEDYPSATKVNLPASLENVRIQCYPHDVTKQEWYLYKYRELVKWLNLNDMKKYLVIHWVVDENTFLNATLPTHFVDCYMSMNMLRMLLLRPEVTVINPRPLLCENDTEQFESLARRLLMTKMYHLLSDSIQVEQGLQLTPDEEKEYSNSLVRQKYFIKQIFAKELFKEINLL